MIVVKDIIQDLFLFMIMPMIPKPKQIAVTSNENVIAGTTVDREITSPAYFDFTFNLNNHYKVLEYQLIIMFYMMKIIILLILYKNHL